MKLRKLKVRRSVAEEEETQGSYLSTGSTLLNLAISGRADGGFLPSKYFFFVGDSASGKTFFCMTCFAEACHNPAFQGYRLIYDNVEDGMLMDVRGLFGEETAKRVEPPARDKDGEPVYSETVEEFYFHVDDAIRAGTPFVYVLDSMDGLSSEAEGEKFEERKKAYRKGKEVAGSYGDGKAKINSTHIRKVVAGVRDTGSILIVIAQTRDNIGAMGNAPRKTRSGGHALKFYATCEIWTSVIGAIKRTVKGKARKVGSFIKLAVRKNRITGKEPEVVTAIYPSYGIDDVGSMVDYLVEEGVWKKAKEGGSMNAPELDLQGTREKIIRAIEGDPKLTRKLKRLVEKTWREVEEACALKRKRRYE